MKPVLPAVSLKDIKPRAPTNNLGLFPKVATPTPANSPSGDPLMAAYADLSLEVNV
jgi:hypothetical protein